jgi:hypothetical protein
VNFELFWGGQARHWVVPNDTGPPPRLVLKSQAKPLDSRRTPATLIVSSSPKHKVPDISLSLGTDGILV